MKNTSNSPKVKTSPVQGHSPQESLPDIREAPKPGRPALKIENILVPTDFSDYSRKALRYAVSLAEQLGAKITVLHVIEAMAVSYPYAGYPYVVEPDEIMPAAEAAANKMCKEEKIDPQLIRQTLVQEGISYQEIVQTAKTLKMDLIIIATQGRTGLAHVLLGSTTERVVRHAPCPVLVVREKEREFVPA